MSEVGQIVQKLVPELGEPAGEATPLEGGITNRNYSVTLGGKRYVIREPGKDTNLLGIDREGERQANESAAKLGIAPPVVAMFTDPPCLVTEFVDGEGMSEEDLQDPNKVARIAPELRKMHDSGTKLPTRFDTVQIAEDYAGIARERGVEVPAAYDEAMGFATKIKSAASGPEHDPVPCHNDLLAANFLDDGNRIWIFDWEYAGMGDRYFDLGNFSVNNGLDEGGRDQLLESYFGEAPDSRRRATLNLFRFMSDFREAMWGVIQQGISDLDEDFPAYAKQHFDRMLETAADPKFEDWLEAAGGS